MSEEHTRNSCATRSCHFLKEALTSRERVEDDGIVMLGRPAVKRFQMEIRDDGKLLPFNPYDVRGCNPNNVI